MPELFTIMIVVAVIATGAFIFAIWLAVWVGALVIRVVATIVRVVWRLGVESIPPSPSFGPGAAATRRPTRVLTRRCRNQQCGAGLPGAAKFCTRCGMSTNVIIRQVA